MIEFSRVWAMPNKWTFTIKPIRFLLDKYVDEGIGWADPYAGMNSPAEFTNDHNPEMPTKQHLEAEDFVKTLPDNLNGVLFDPPYSYRQVSEHYRLIGKKATQEDTSALFYSRVIDILAKKIKVGGLVISCGWNTQGFGINRGFEIIEVLIVPHGGRHNDTLVTVERKVKGDPSCP